MDLLKSELVAIMCEGRVKEPETGMPAYRPCDDVASGDLVCVRGFPALTIGGIKNEIWSTKKKVSELSPRICSVIVTDNGGESYRTIERLFGDFNPSTTIGTWGRQFLPHVRSIEDLKCLRNVIGNYALAVKEDQPDDD